MSLHSELKALHYEWGYATDNDSAYSYWKGLGAILARHPEADASDAKALLDAADEADDWQSAHDVAECAGYVEGETGRQGAIDRWIGLCEDPASWLRARAAQLQVQAPVGEGLENGVSDEHHTMDELYEYRMLYNAHAAHGWVSAGVPVVKSWLHSDGELCFGGGWFIVVATLPSGQVSNHYAAEHWDLFDVPEANRPPEYDGHTPEVAAKRLRDGLMAPTQLQPQATVGDSPQARDNGDDDTFCPDKCDHWDTGSECPNYDDTVSDGEREAIINELHAVEGMLGLSHYRGEKLTADEMNQGRTALESARECIAAGYRKAPVVNVEDVARVIAPWLSTTLQDPDYWQMTRATDIATAIKAHLLDGGDRG